MSIKQECPHCKSRDILIEGVNNFFCKQCGQNGLIRPQSRIHPRLVDKEPAITEKRYYDPDCPKCQTSMNERGNVFICPKCKYFQPKSVLK